MKILLILLPLLIMKCSDTDNNTTQEDDKKALEVLASEIKVLADQSVCSDEFTCEYVGFGSKACGGFKGYLVYSNSIDVSELLAKVKSYNEKEHQYNQKWGIISDCMFVMPPTSVVCENGKCIAVYN